jgi:hypothetical protein
MILSCTDAAKLRMLCAIIMAMKPSHLAMIVLQVAIFVKEVCWNYRSRLMVRQNA